MLTEFLIYGIMIGSVYALIALGFALIYSTVRFFHFAHGAVYTIGAYLVFTFFVLWKLPFIFSAILAVLLAGMLGVGMEFFVYQFMRRRRATKIHLLIASLGLLIALQNLVALIFGSDTKTIRSNRIQEGYNVFGAKVTSIQVIIVVFSLTLFVVISLILKYTDLGKSLRAVANDPEMAFILGVNKSQITYITYFAGSVLAGGAAILISLDVDLTPMMGFNALLYGVVAVVIGGVGKISWAYWGGLLLGLAQYIGVWQVSSKWQDAIAFAILIFFLLLKPKGIADSFLRRKAV